MKAESVRSLEEQRLEFSQGRFLAMPIAGTIAWTLIGIAGAFVPVGLASWILFICTGMIFMLGLLVARLTGRISLERRVTTTNLTSFFSNRC